MPTARLLKVYTDNSYYDEYDRNQSFYMAVKSDIPTLELTQKELNDLVEKVNLFNNNKWRLKPTPDYYLLVVEDVSEVPMSKIFEDLEVLIAEDERKKAQEAERRRKAAEKKKAATAEADRQKKLKQLQKLQEELGIKE